MKVVLFCGGQGLRMRSPGEDLPKPMAPIGQRPVLWHLMKYYAHYGHKDFILCLGYGADAIKRFFIDYQESESNDFVYSDGGRRIELMNRDLSDWRITFVDTGMSTNIGQRLRAVRKYLSGEEVFLANYADGLTDLDLPTYVDEFVRSGMVASFLSVKPNLSLHAVTYGASGELTGIVPVRATPLRVNGGFFALRQEVFEYIRDGEELVEEPFRRLIEQRKITAYEFDGFFAAVDTFKDKLQLDQLSALGPAPWEVWKPRSRPKTPAQALPGV